MSLVDPNRAGAERETRARSQGLGFEDRGIKDVLREGQYIVVQVGSIHTDFPGPLVAYALP